MKNEKSNSNAITVKNSHSRKNSKKTEEEVKNEFKKSISENKFLENMELTKKAEKLTNV